VLAGAAHCGPVPGRTIGPRWTVLLAAVKHGPCRRVRTTLPQPRGSAAPDTGRLPVVPKCVRCLLLRIVGVRRLRQPGPVDQTDEQARTAGGGRRAATATVSPPPSSGSRTASTADTAAGRGGVRVAVELDTAAASAVGRLLVPGTAAGSGRPVSAADTAARVTARSRPAGVGWSAGATATTTPG
jgi:hypothetical protein